MSQSAEPDDLSVYDRLRRSDAELEAWLAAGTHQREVIACLGEAEYALLSPIAQAAATRPPRSDCHVFLLAGIMGSQLGRPRAMPWPANLLWLDPVDVMAGRLRELRLPDAQPLQPLGTIAYTYYALKLRLQAAGFAVTMHHYDWRQDIATLGAQLAAQLRQSSAETIYLVCHSMGGLVARAAMTQPDAARVKRAILIGTPNHGTFAPVQALRGTYPTVRRLAAIDHLHSAEMLAEIFATFPSLYDMLPQGEILTRVPLFDPDTWPADGPRPDAAQLRNASTVSKRLAAHDARCHCIVGTQQRTVTGIVRRDREFVYTISSEGDGTVPIASATQAATGNYFLASEHSNLPRSPAVAQAVLELLATGRCDSLPQQPSPPVGAEVQVSDAELRTTYLTKIDWRALTPEQRALYLNQLNLTPPQYAAP
jgi:pimeloyl-ACP methyl ester carboxylesterase